MGVHVRAAYAGAFLAMIACDGADSEGSTGDASSRGAGGRAGTATTASGDGGEAATGGQGASSGGGAGGDDGPPYTVDGNYTWVSLPLRSASLAGDGDPGGEGMQWPFDIDFAPSDANRAYLVTDTSQVWRSDDGGRSWSRAAAGFDPQGGLSLAVDPTDPDWVLVAGSVHLGDRHAPEADGIWLSRNGGASWERRQTERFLRVHHGGDNFAFGARADQVLCGTHGDGLRVSSDRGETWSSVAALSNAVVKDVEALPGVNDGYIVATTNALYRFDVGGGVTTLGGGLPGAPINVAVDPTNANRMWVTVAQQGVYRSTNGGTSFQAATTGMNHLDVNWLEVSPADPNRLYTSMRNLGGNSIWTSSNGGNSWSRNTSIFSHAAVSANQGGFFFGTPFAASPSVANDSLAMAAANIIVRTDDGGDAWDYSGTGFTGSRVIEHGHALGDHGDADTYTLFLVDFGVVRTTDNGATFQNLNAPLHRSRLTTHAGAVQPGSQGQTIITAVGDYTEQRLTVSFDGGANWTQTPHLGSINFISFLPGEDDTVFAGRYRSLDGGQSWTALSRRVGAIAPDGGTIYAFDDRDIYRSLDRGDTWEPAFARLDCTVHELGFRPEAPFTVFALGGGCGVYTWENDAWVERGDGDGLALDALGSRDARSIAFSPQDPDFMCVGKWAAYRAHTNGVFCSGDGGATWRDFTFDLDLPFTPWSLAFHDDGRLFMGSSHGNYILGPGG
ncbi:MAG: hypothetical protein AAGN82_29530 [Myxococcota bacterium]